MVRIATDSARRLAALGEPLGQAGLLGAQLGGLPVELVGVAAGPFRLGVGREQPDPLGGQALHRAELLGERGEREPGLLRAGQLGRLRLDRDVERGLAGARVGERRLKLGAAGADRGLVGLLALQLAAQVHVVVGEQPELGVAQLRLDGGGLAARPRPACRAA